MLKVGAPTFNMAATSRAMFKVMRRADLIPAVRERLERFPPPHDSHYGVVPSPPPEHVLRFGAAEPRHRAALEAMARIDALAGELADPYLISRVLGRREAVTSSAIEGTNSTLDELLVVEETSDDAATAAARQVRDYAVVLERFLPKARAEGPVIFDQALVADLHRAVMAGDTAYRDETGALRSVVVCIGGGGNIAYSTYNPTPPGRVAACLDDTLRYMSEPGRQIIDQSLLVRMAVAHAHFEAVHPFRDGNGRVGRLLMPLMMAAEGRTPLYLSPFMESHRDGYYAALKAAQQRLDWSAIVGFLADAVLGTEAELMATRRALAQLERIWARRRAFRAGSTAARTLAILPHYPVVTARRLSALLGVSFPAAAQALGALAAMGVVTERTGYARNRVFTALEALAVLNRPFGEEPVLPEC